MKTATVELINNVQTELAQAGSHILTHRQLLRRGLHTDIHKFGRVRERPTTTRVVYCRVVVVEVV